MLVTSMNASYAATPTLNESDPEGGEAPGMEFGSTSPSFTPLTAFSRRPRPDQLTRIERLPVVVLFGVCVVLLLVAAWLPPAPAGFGTHQQLGLAACGFKATTGVPCATCGMTTAFSHMAHAQPLASFYVQPAGAVLAIITALIAVVTGFSLLTGMPLGPLASRIFRPLPLIAFGGFFLASWCYAIWLHAHILPA